MNTLSKRRQAFYKHLAEINAHGIHFPEDELRQALQVAYDCIALRGKHIPYDDFADYLESKHFIKKVMSKHGIKNPRKQEKK